MEIKLTPQECEEIFYNAMCNGLSCGYGLSFDVDNVLYQKAKQSLRQLQQINPNQSICYEDVYIEVLRQGGKMDVYDEEGDGEYNRSITLKDIHKRVPKVPPTYLVQMIAGEDDAETADKILQIVFFKEIIFG